jgi:hypothetical protein
MSGCFALTDTDINYQYPKKVIWNISHHTDLSQTCLDKVSESLFQSVGFFNLFNIIYTILPVEDLTPNHRVSKLGLEPQAWAYEIWSRAQAHCKPSSGLGWAWAWMGSAWRAQGLKSGPALQATLIMLTHHTLHWHWKPRLVERLLNGV